MTEPATLAVDLGTGGAKVALVTPRGRVLASEFEAVPLLLLPGGGAEQRPEDWWRAITTASRRLLARGIVRLGDLAAICCSAQWSGTVAVDRSGKPLIMTATEWLEQDSNLDPIRNTPRFQALLRRMPRS